MNKHLITEQSTTINIKLKLRHLKNLNKKVNLIFFLYFHLPFIKQILIWHLEILLCYLNFEEERITMYSK